MDHGSRIASTKWAIGPGYGVKVGQCRLSRLQRRGVDLKDGVKTRRTSRRTSRCSGRATNEKTGGSKHDHFGLLRNSSGWDSGIC